MQHSKGLLLIGCLSLLFVGCGRSNNNSSDVTYPGATLVQTINTGVIGARGMSYYNNELYVTGYTDTVLTKISLATGSTVPGYPVYLPEAPEYVNPVGLAVDGDDGSIWVCYWSYHWVRHYDPSLNLLGSATLFNKPANALVHDGKVYIADAQADKVSVYNESTHELEREIGNIEFMSKSVEADMFIYSNKLYVISYFTEAVSLQRSGIYKMDLDGRNREKVYVGDITHLSGNGIYIQDDRIYLNVYTGIIVIDLSGNILNQWDFADPAGSTGRYSDIEIVNGKIYVLSMSGSTESHILVYTPNP